MEEDGEFLQSYTFDSTGMLAEVTGDTMKKSVTEILDEKGNQMGALQYVEFGRLENPEEENR